MSNIGRNDPCPSGAGVKFKKCLRQHSGLNLNSSAGAIWWVCDRWQADEPEFDDVMKTWRDLDDPDPDKVERFLERMFGEPVDSIDWARMLEGFHTKHYRDLPGLYRRMNTSISGLPGREMGRFLGSAVEIARVDQPEMYEELLAAILELDPDDTQMESLESIVSWANEQERAEDCDRLRKRFLQFPQFLLEESDEEEEQEPEIGRENGLPKFPPEIERQLDLAWDEFKAIKSLTADDAEALLEC